MPHVGAHAGVYVWLHLQGKTLEEIAILKADNDIESIVLPGLKLKVSTVLNV